MRTSVVSVLVGSLVCGGLGAVAAFGAVTSADAAPRPAATSHYRDAALASRPQLDLTGTLQLVDSEAPGSEDGYVVRTADGLLVPVSLDLAAPLEHPATFTGSVAVGSALAGRLARRGVRTAARRHLAAGTAEARTALDTAATQTAPLPVTDATITTAPAAAVTASSQRLYAAVIDNRGTIEESHATIQGYLDAMRSYWQTDAGGLITSFTQPTATVYYDSSTAPDTSAGCGIGSPSAVWNEAAQQFPGVNFNAAGNHLMVVVADDCSGNSGAGVGTVGRSLASGGDTLVSLGDVAVAIGVHELGHNFSLQHANAQQCSSSCSTVGYYDIYSIMGLAVGGGGWTPPSLDTARRVQLGIADSSEAPTVTAPDTEHLAGRGTDTGERGFVVTDPSSGTRYAVDYRSGSGRDSSAFYATKYSLGSFAYRPGVTVERLESDGSTTLMTTTSGSSTLTSLTAGQALTVGSLTFTVTAAAPSTGADVQVSVPGSSPTASPAPSTSSPTSSTPTPPTSTPPTPPTSTPTSSSSTPTPTTGLTATRAPRVDGTPRVGSRVYAYPGSWTPRPERATIQWLAGGTPVGSGWSYTPTAADLGKSLTIRVTVGRTGYADATATSAASSAVQRGRFAPGRPRVHGTARVGHTLHASAGSWSPTARLAYRWYADGRRIAGASGSALTLTRGTAGRHVSVLVVASRPGYATAAAASARTPRVR